MKKKMSAIVFAFSVLLSMTACGSDTDTVQMPEQKETALAEGTDRTSSESVVEE